MNLVDIIHFNHSCADVIHLLPPRGCVLCRTLREVIRCQFVPQLKRNSLINSSENMAAFNVNQSMIYVVHYN